MRFSETAYDDLLQEARDVAERSRERFRNLYEHYPEAFAEEDVEGMERLRRTQAWDRRRGVRWPLHEKQIEAQPVDALGPSVRGRVLDQSASGVGILLTWPVPSGTYLHVWTDLSSTADPALVEVKRCQVQVDGWLLGCEVFGDALHF